MAVCIFFIYVTTPYASILRGYGDEECSTFTRLRADVNQSDLCHPPDWYLPGRLITIFRTISTNSSSLNGRAGKTYVVGVGSFCTCMPRKIPALGILIEMLIDWEFQIGGGGVLFIPCFVYFTTNNRPISIVRGRLNSRAISSGPLTRRRCVGWYKVCLLFWDD